MSSLWQKSKNKMYILYFCFLFLKTLRVISLKWLCLLVGRYPDSNQIGVGRVAFS